MSYDLAVNGQHGEATHEDDGWTLPGLELSHDMAFSLVDWRAWPAILRLLEEIDAEIVSFNVVAREDAGWLLRCRAKAIPASKARALVAEIRDANLACTASVEHLMMRGEVHSRTR
jgi:hypothetical protein